MTTANISTGPNGEIVTDLRDSSGVELSRSIAHSSGQAYETIVYGSSAGTIDYHYDTNGNVSSATMCSNEYNGFNGNSVWYGQWQDQYGDGGGYIGLDGNYDGWSGGGSVQLAPGWEGMSDTADDGGTSAYESGAIDLSQYSAYQALDTSDQLDKPLDSTISSVLGNGENVQLAGDVIGIYTLNTGFIDNGNTNCLYFLFGNLSGPLHLDVYKGVVSCPDVVVKPFP